MKKITIFGFLLLILAVGCSKSDSEELSLPDNRAKTRMLTITQVESPTSPASRPSVGVRRASLTDSVDELLASWTRGDELTYCNLSEYIPVSGPLTATSTAAISPFKGNVSCYTNDKLAVVYPATTFTSEEYFFAYYSVSLSGQVGTLASLASDYHYVYGVATVEGVTETTADATMPKMKSLLTACKFSFKEKGTNAAIPVNRLTISYDNDGLEGNTGTYPQTATVTCSETQANVHAVATPSDSPLLIQGTGETEIYVALMPTNGQRTFRFTVSNTNGTYTGTARATLGEGEFVVATGLKLTKQ